jgi:hypothetical protein
VTKPARAVCASVGVSAGASERDGGLLESLAVVQATEAYHR